MKKQYIFKSIQDAKNALSWINEFLIQEGDVAYKSENFDTVVEEIEEAKLLLRDIADYVNSNGDLSGLNQENLNDLWQKILFLNDDTYINQRDPDQVSWGLWRIGDKQEHNFSHTQGPLYKVVIPENSDHKIHYYRTIPSKISWELTEVAQKGFKFYISCARVEEIEKVSSVPALPSEITSIESGRRVLDSTLGINEWQRRPIPKRIQSITEFADLNENIVVNAPILYLNQNSNAKIINNVLEIDFSCFLRKDNLSDYYIDHIINEDKVDELNNFDKKYVDLRPIWLIDGQHRVRGLSSSDTGKVLTIPIIILPCEFGLHNAAKIFSEINTLQESLKPLHKLFMQHRFSIPSPNPKRDFTTWEIFPDRNIDSRANHLSYQLLARLAANEDSALRGKIRILEQNDASDSYVKADQWVNYARAWFISSGPYSNIVMWSKEREQDIYNEVNNYFLAFISTVNHSEWKDGKERWPDAKRYKSLLQSSTHFKVLIDLYRDVYVRLNKKGNIATIAEFKKVLVPFKWVDWIDKDLKSMFGGGGERGRSSLYIWMFDALRSKESHPQRSVMSKNIKSEAGKGIFAPPAKSEIRIIHGLWPQKNKPVVFKSERPINARNRPIWIITDNLNETYTDLLKVKSNTECYFEYNSIIDSVKSFRISVQWSNASNINATSFIDISNPLKSN